MGWVKAEDIWCSYCGAPAGWPCVADDIPSAAEWADLMVAYPKGWTAWVKTDPPYKPRWDFHEARYTDAENTSKASELPTKAEALESLAMTEQDHQWQKAKEDLTKTLTDLLDQDIAQVERQVKMGKLDQLNEDLKAITYTKPYEGKDLPQIKGPYFYEKMGLEHEPEKEPTIIMEDHSKGPPLPPNLQPKKQYVHVADIVHAISCPLCHAAAGEECNSGQDGYVHVARAAAYKKWQKGQDKGPESGANKGVYLHLCPTCKSQPGVKCREQGKIVAPHYTRLIAAGLLKPKAIQPLVCPSCGGTKHWVERVILHQHEVLGHYVQQVGGNRVILKPVQKVEWDAQIPSLHCYKCMHITILSEESSLDQQANPGPILVADSEDKLATWVIEKPVNIEEL